MGWVGFEMLRSMLHIASHNVVVADVVTKGATFMPFPGPLEFSRRPCYIIWISFLASIHNFRLVSIDIQSLLTKHNILFDLITTAVPVITRHPNDNGNITVAEGNDVTLRCTATGNGTLNYQWRRVSGSLPSNSRLRSNGNLDLFNITVSDSGQYYCEVSDGGDSVPSMRVQVTARSELLITTVSFLIGILYVQGNPPSLIGLKSKN